MLFFFKKYGKQLMIGIASSIAFILMVTAIAMLVRYTKEVSERSTAQAQYYTQNVKISLIDSLNDTTAKVISAAAGLEGKNTQGELNDYLNALKTKTDLFDLKEVRYFKGNELYTSYGDLLHEQNNDPAYTFRAENPNGFGFIGSFLDNTHVTEGSMNLIGFYAPVQNCELADAIVIYYTWSKVETFFPYNIRNDVSFFSVLTNQNGKIIVGDDEVEKNDIFEDLRLRIGEKAPIDQLKSLVNSRTDGTIAVNIEGVDYLISIGADASHLKGLTIIELYEVNKLCASTYSIISSLLAIFIAFAVILICAIGFLMVRHLLLRRQYFNKETNDKALECYNRYGFEKEIDSILNINRGSYFSVIVIQIRHYSFLYESFGEAEINRLLTYLRLLCAKTCEMEEVYGYMENGEYLLLLHAKDRAALLERLRIHAFLASKYRAPGKNLDVILKYGIYEVDLNDNATPSQMIDFANEANNTMVKATAENAGMQFNFYNMELRKVRLINEDMELRMETALVNGEFQVFYQPKYNLRLGRQDGCEALVRWYDQKTGEYNRPALFMPLFESNGFIVKLDKYVYTKVCEYLSYSIAQGRPVFPVSVNVSRITAVQPDFIEYYSKTKRKYGLAEGLIMIEFTESFAYENDEILRNIVDELHKNGFKCSIDDFGCGYSSYRILKTLPMDEIKLDKFFIDKGNSTDRDNEILRSIISLGKTLGMKVTQEGVETKEDIDRLIQLGCDVLQGYYYARPLSLSDYISFVANSKDHNITKK